ncbi:potassium transporter [Comamonas serinivorans]|uniref:Potassium transporter n=1 Tax=Comamonas serinivorans TaxID=1082851 RepID=A0A1Y0EPD2_9BURK|nr:monovalent cation:proton antiporter-2 (CPA2) family protein [Comamonas serinivorans]ARU05179.1 potassium transporter [Comamonas serinivorans]
MSAASTSVDLGHVVALLGAAVVAVPLFKRLGLGTVLGYLAAGVVIGPFGLRLFQDPQAILHTAELGVVMFLFVIGLEMRPSHLWSLRRDIFGLGSLQVGACALVLTLLGLAVGLTPAVAFVCGMGFVLTSTAIVMQILSERGDVAQTRGQKMVSILLFEDLLIVPLLAWVAFVAPPQAGAAQGSRWVAVAMGVGAVLLLLAVGRWLLNPMFRVLANAKAREVMTAAALLVVLGAALLMQVGGLSMAMGAFLAGVLLSESAYRHQLEADIEPFRGLLLGLFFLGVGMSLDLTVVAQYWQQVVLGVLVMMAVKALGVYGVARLTRSSHADALDRAVLMAQGGEFAFVLYTTAVSERVISAQTGAVMTAIVVLSMALTPVVLIAMKRLQGTVAPSMDGVAPAENLCGKVLLIGFGRFGQIVSQGAIARGASIAIIDADAEAVRDSNRYGFQVYFGDGSRLDVLHAAGAGQARAIVVCVDDAEAATRITELCKQSFPQAQVLVRAWDREHALALVQANADYVIRETFESALAMGRETVIALGATSDEADAWMAEQRERDSARFALEMAGGRFAGRDLLYFNRPSEPS